MPKTKEDLDPRLVALRSVYEAGCKLVDREPVKSIFEESGLLIKTRLMPPNEDEDVQVFDHNDPEVDYVFDFGTHEFIDSDGEKFSGEEILSVIHGRIEQLVEGLEGWVNILPHVEPKGFSVKDEDEEKEGKDES